MVVVVLVLVLVLAVGVVIVVDVVIVILDVCIGTMVIAADAVRAYIVRDNDMVFYFLLVRQVLSAGMVTLLMMVRSSHLVLPFCLSLSLAFLLVV